MSRTIELSGRAQALAREPSPAELAAAHGLSVCGERPSMAEYTRRLWALRHFIGTLATARLTAQYSTAKLGQIWQIMTPLLNAAVYYFVFGVLLGTGRQVPDFVPFLVTGVFVWNFTSTTISTGTRAITGSIGLVRALHFPRAGLPLASALQQLQQLLFSMGVLAVLLVCFGQHPRPSWLLAVPALFLQALFNTGCALTVARLAHRMPDISQLTPFFLRTWMYGSGVMWSLDHVLSRADLPHFVVLALEGNPAAVYIDLMRFALIDSFTAAQLPPHVWFLAITWAVLAGFGGFVYFWKAEEEYGRG
ncbi:ABC transporter permease [Streptomyces sp. NPDC051219]|uniref:ABC transporter permease n=1 Tax=Streptomyces sp. NPDC051219 TaxID=3155283 RepID=UPI00342F5B5F